MTYIEDWIDIKELRLCNYVSFTDPSGKTCNMLVGGVTPDEILLWLPSDVSPVDKVEVSNGITIRGWQDGPEINPIPLTKDLLLQCGFDILVGRSCYSWVDKIYSTPDANLVLYCKNNSYRFAREMFGIDGWKLVDVNGYNFIYLHQLQNLYFALTGEDLEINL